MQIKDASRVRVPEVVISLLIPAIVQIDEPIKSLDRGGKTPSHRLGYGKTDSHPPLSAPDQIEG